MKIKNLFILGVFLIGVLAFSGLASAIVNIESVKLDGDTLDPSITTDVRSIDKGDEFEVKVEVRSDVDYKNAQIEVYLRGYDYDDMVDDISSVFDMKANTTYIKKLTLTFPKRMDQDAYKLRVEVANRGGVADYETYDLAVETGRHDVAIKDVVLSPANGIMAGRALLATVRLQNYGKTAEDDVKVTFSIPALGISASDYIDTLEPDGDDKDSKSSEELYLRIPQCATPGEYDALVTVSFHDGDKTVKKDMTVDVFADETCEAAAEEAPASGSGKTMIVVGPESQDVAKGAGGVIYPVTITNAGSAKTYVVSVTGGDWGTFRISPSNVVTVGKDETKTVYIYAAAKDSAPEGTQVFGVAIKSGDKTLQEVTLKANVVAGSSSVNLKRALEIGLIVLVIILVILGLIIGFNKLKGNDEEKEEGQSYY